jgi:hypothetical protein
MCHQKLECWLALATSSLAVKKSVHRRISTVNPMCSICGTDMEGEHHDVVCCALAKTLRDGMSSWWSLPSEADLLQPVTENGSSICRAVSTQR